jgi:hypothetical protein
MPVQIVLRAAVSALRLGKLVALILGQNVLIEVAIDTWAAF